MKKGKALDHPRFYPPKVSMLASGVFIVLSDIIARPYFDQAFEQVPRPLCYLLVVTYWCTLFMLTLLVTYWLPKCVHSKLSRLKDQRKPKKGSAPLKQKGKTGKHYRTLDYLVILSVLLSIPLSFHVTAFITDHIFKKVSEYKALDVLVVISLGLLFMAPIIVTIALILHLIYYRLLVFDFRQYFFSVFGNSIRNVFGACASTPERRETEDHTFKPQ